MDKKSTGKTVHNVQTRLVVSLLSNCELSPLSIRFSSEYYVVDMRRSSIDMTD